MNFGAFAGGFSHGLEQGMKNGKNIRELIKEGKLQDLREKGMAEAEAQRASAVQGMIQEGGVTGAPTSGPVDTSTPKVETPQPANAEAVSAASPTASPDAAGAKTAASAMAPVSPAAVSAASPTANPDAAAANAATAAQGTAPSVSTQAPAAPSPVQATPQQGVAATGVTQATPAPAPAPAPAAAAPAPATPVQKPNGKFSVNGQSYDTREQALAAAEKAAPSANDYFMKNAVPKLAEQYLANGEPEKAKAWTDYADSHNGKRAIKDWAAAYTAPDFDTAATKFGKYYTEHINDGVDYTGHKMLTKEDGSQVAVVSLKDKATGKSIEMEMTREKMLAMGAANNPQKLFETEQAKQTLAEKLKYEARLKAQQRKEDYSDKSKLENEKQDRIDEREAGKVSTKKTTDPTERRALIRSDEMKNNPKFARMSKDEQNKAIDAAMETVYGTGSSKADASEKPAVVIADKPMAFNKDLPVKYRKSDGKAFHVVDGKFVPIDGAVPTSPAAGGMPQKK